MGVAWSNCNFGFKNHLPQIKPQINTFCFVLCRFSNMLKRPKGEHKTIRSYHNENISREKSFF